MKKSFVLKLCVANPTDKFKVGFIYDEIEKGLISSEVYRIDRSKVNCAAVEMIIIINAIADIVTIIWFLYQVWKEFKDIGDLFIAADPESDIQIIISNKTSNKEMREFQAKIIKLRKTNRAKEIYNKTIIELKQRIVWRKTK